MKKAQQDIALQLRDVIWAIMLIIIVGIAILKILNVI